MIRLIAIVLTLSLANSLQAQTPPSAVQINLYDGLHKAAHEGDETLIRQLVANGANVNAVDSSGRTPAHVAAFASNDDALRALAEAGADMNALEYGLYDVVTIAAVADNPAMVALAIELGNRADNITSIYVGTALIAAAHLGHHEVVEILIDCGAPLDHINNLHWTALIESVVLGDGGPDHLATAKALVKAGADISIGDRNGVTALDHAISLGYSEMQKAIKSP